MGMADRAMMSHDDDHTELLERVLRRQSPSLLYVTTIDSRKVQPEIRREIERAIVSELVDTGLGDDDEPNAYGLELEALIDWVLRSFRGPNEAGLLR